MPREEVKEEHNLTSHYTHHETPARKITFEIFCSPFHTLFSSIFSRDRSANGHKPAIARRKNTFLFSLFSPPHEKPQRLIDSPCPTLMSSQSKAPLNTENPTRNVQRRKRSGKKNRKRKWEWGGDLFFHSFVEYIMDV